MIIALKKYVPGWEYIIAEGNMPIYSEAGVEAVGGLDATDRNAPDPQLRTDVGSSS